MNARAFYNENDPLAAAWLRNLGADGLLPVGDVYERDIRDVRPSDLDGYAACHFFAGIGGWPLALRLASLPDDFACWTGSCPCQPFSTAGRRGGTADERHLWPHWHHLIRECRPATVFGEQVASADGMQWLDLVSDDLEGAGYAFGALNMPACAVGAPHLRQRLWFVAHAAGDGREGLQRSSEAQVPQDWAPQALGAWNRLGDPFSNWPQLLARADVRRLADGVSSYVGVRPALRAYGNAIVPQAAAEFVRACL